METPQIECGVFLGVEPKEDGYALHFERAIVLISRAAALALRYMLE